MTSKAREAAADFLNEVLVQAFDNLDLDTIQESWECELEEAIQILWEVGSATVSVLWEDGGDCDCCDDEMDGVSIGDPDPTPAGYVVGEYDACAQSDGRYVCTRESGHDGIHIAGDGSEVCAVWL